MQKDLLTKTLIDNGFTVGATRKDGNCMLLLSGTRVGYIDWSDPLLLKNGSPIARFDFMLQSDNKDEQDLVKTYKTYHVGGHWPKGVSEIKLDTVKTVKIMCKMIKATRSKAEVTKK